MLSEQSLETRQSVQRSRSTVGTATCQHVIAWCNLTRHFKKLYRDNTVDFDRTPQKTISPLSQMVFLGLPTGD